MIGSFRNFAKTKFAGILVFIIIIPFVFWGMGSMFSGGNTNSLAKIGDAVTTSPASTLLPPNLTIGIVKFVNEKALPSPYAIVQLTASPEAIDWVQVLKNDAQK